MKPYLNNLLTSRIFFSIVLALSLSLTALAALAQERTSLSRHIHTINVFSGAPQPSDLPGATGGFGDVAANLVAATEIKMRHPELKVRLLVTSAAHRYDRFVPTTIEILKIMVPELSPEKKQVSQFYKNIEVVFIDFDFAPALSEQTDDHMSEIINQIGRTLPSLIPRADLNLSFSVFPESSMLLRINAPIALGVEEQYGSKKIVNEVFAADSQLGAYAELASGPNALGFMLSEEQIPHAQAIEKIETWMKSNGFTPNQGKLRPLIAYTADWRAAQVYIDAIAALPQVSPLVLMVKDLPELDFSGLSKDIQVVRIKAMPSEVMKAAIQESVLSPLVTGDISFGQALSSVRSHKTFVYEAPEWKVESADGAQKNLARDLGLNHQQLSPMFLKTEVLEKLNREELKIEGRRLARLIGDQSFQEGLYAAIRNRSQKWDLLGNTLGIASETLKLAENEQNPKMSFLQTDRIQQTAKYLVQRFQGRDLKSKANLFLSKVKKAFLRPQASICSDLFVKP